MNRNSKMYRIMLGIASSALLLGAMVITSCEDAENPADEDPVPKTIGMLFPTDEDGSRWGDNDIPILTERLESAGVVVSAYGHDNEAGLEANSVSALISAGVDAVIYCPVDKDAAADSIALFHDAGIPVVCYDRLATGTSLIEYYVAYDNIEIGEAMGQTIAAAAAQAGGNGLPLYLYTGHTGDYNSVLFFRGSWNILQPKIADGTFEIQNSPAAIAYKNKPSLTDTEITEIIEETTTGWDIVSGTTKALVEANLDAPAAVKGNVYILAPNDYTSRIIADEFLLDSGITGIRAITGQDGESASLQRVINGTQTMTIPKTITDLCDTVAKTAIAVAAGTIPSDVTLGTLNNGTADIPICFVPIRVVSNAQDVQELIDDGLYESGSFTFP